MKHPLHEKCGLGLFFLAAGIFSLSANDTLAQENIIRLTQTGCQFVETEGVDHGFQTAAAADCNRINAQTAAKRLKTVKVLRLKPGQYTFRVTNKNVPYELGFWLRGAGIGRLTLPSVSGGGIRQGNSRDYGITLEAGEYRYSCPLNPTPDYTLVVSP